MNIKKHLPWLGALLPVASMQAETKPNVVVIYVDDMGIGDIGCYGGKFVPTPNIDKIAQDGLLFNQYYSSAPVSSPSRCGLTTGKFPIEVGINTFLNNKASNKKCEQRNFLSDKNPSMARAFQNAGYATGHIGKWHMGGGRDVHNAPSIKNYGFDEYISTYESPDPEPAITATPWVPEFKQKDNKSWNTEEAFIPVLAEMDKQIGRFIKALDELGLSENTIVIFTSDNGPAPSFQSARAAYLRGTKNSLYEGGIRMPFLIKYPKKIKAGQVNNESVLCAVDLYPSLCAIAGIETEKGYQGDGQNYDKVLLGKSKAKRKTDLMWDFGRNQFFKKPGNVNDRSPHLAIRSGNWKLLINSDGSDAQLYDIEKDKFEKNDVAQSHPQVVAKLSKKVCKWFTENKDKGKE